MEIRNVVVGLGDEDSVSLERMERVGKVALRETAKLGVKRAAFAPLIRDQGNSTFGTGDVGQVVTRGLLLAHDTQKRLQKEVLAKALALEEWVVEAGPDYFDDTVRGVQKATEEAKTAAAKRPSDPYSRGKK